MKRILLFVLFTLFFFQIASSTVIKVEVPKDLKGNISSFSYNYTLNILKFQIEYYNTGSVAYKVRNRIDILNDSKEVFTGWSEEKSLMPGDRKNFEIYSYINSTGNFTVKARSYFANEILEQKFSIEKSTSILSENVFEIKNFRTYDDFVIFDVKAKENVRNVVIIPSDFPVGWIFEQKKIDSIDKNNEKTVILHYYPTIWTQENLTLAIASDEGRYYTEKIFELKKEAGIQWLIYYIIDNLKIIFKSI